MIHERSQQGDNFEDSQCLYPPHTAATRIERADPMTTDAMLRHIVVFRYTQHATQAQIAQVTDAFRALQHQIPGIRAFEHGVNNSPEGKNQGFTHVYVLTFIDAAARDAYLPHPAHQAFGTLLGRLGVLDDVFVVDYVTVVP